MEPPPPIAPQTHIAILPTPGMGHLVPLVEFARKLLHQPGFAVTFIIPADGLHAQPQKALLETVPAITSIFLPPQTTDDLPADSHLETRILLGLTRSAPSLRRVLTGMNRVSALLVDFFATVAAFDAVAELDIPLYIFFPSSAMTLSFAFFLPHLDRVCAGPFRNLAEPVEVPGCVPLRGTDFPSPLHYKNDVVYKLFMDMCEKYALADGILVNSFLELEPDTFKALEKTAGPPVYPVGPLTRPGSGEDRADCLKWLDNQPASSVLFVSFGSGGTLSTDQLNELALGLELSRQRFLLVARRPDDKVRNAAYFDLGSKHITKRPFDYLPSGFMERIDGKGFVLSNWAPQVEVLGHASVGGFLTHCGWNSTLEGIVNCVPMIAWPLFAEQQMNAVLVSEGLKVGFRVVEDENGVVGRDQVARLVRSLMEGEEGKELRDRMGILKEAGRRALSEGGSSMKSLADVAEKWQNGFTFKTQPRFKENIP